jgi:hypothetical protein
MIDLDPTHGGAQEPTAAGTAVAGEDGGSAPAHHCDLHGFVHSGRLADGPKHDSSLSARKGSIR